MFNLYSTAHIHLLNRHLLLCRTIMNPLYVPHFDIKINITLQIISSREILLFAYTVIHWCWWIFRKIMIHETTATNGTIIFMYSFILFHFLLVADEFLCCWCLKRRDRNYQFVAFPIISYQYHMIRNPGENHLCSLVLWHKAAFVILVYHTIVGTIIWIVCCVFRICSKTWYLFNQALILMNHL